MLLVGLHTQLSSTLEVVQVFSAFNETPLDHVSEAQSLADLVACTCSDRSPQASALGSWSTSEVSVSFSVHKLKATTYESCKDVQVMQRRQQ